MVKKTIAGVLSAVMCATTLLYDAPFSSRNTAQEGEQLPAASTDLQEEMGLTGSNSLSRYLAKQGTEQAANVKPAAQPLKAAAADAVYAVTNLDFDRETGIVQVTSTQSEAATLRASFIDEDSPANVYTVDYGVPAGEYVHSTFSADPAQLPEYFTVSVQLIGRAGLPLCKAFEIKTYNREMQEIIQTEASDFAPEQVVNLDEDETTNFIVLSEDTVRAETTEESNVLVSADYDQNIYVFDHIDESIRSLEKGQYFYIQPTEDDIISTDIQDIVIEGDTATITGSGEIDDMFDFIKIEIDTTQTVIMDDVPGWDIESEGGDTIISEDEMTEEALSEAEESERGYLLPFSVIDNEDDYTKALDRQAKVTEFTHKFTVKKAFSTPGGHFSATPALSTDSKIKMNFYRSGGKFHAFFVVEATQTIGVTFAASANSPASLSDLDSTIPSGAELNPEINELPAMVAKKEEDEKNPDETPKHLIKIPITSIGVADVCFFIDLGVTVNAEGVISAEKTFTKGFVNDGNGVEMIDFDSKMKFKVFSVTGSVTVDFKLGVEVSALKGLVTASVAGGLKVTGTLKVGSGSDNQTYNPTASNIFVADPQTTATCIHADKTCFKIDVSTKVYIEEKLSVGFKFESDNKILKKIGKLNYVWSDSYETDTVMGHKLPHYVVFIACDAPPVFKNISNSNIMFCNVETDPRTGEDLPVECEHKAYRTVFMINFQGTPPQGTQVELVVDGISFPLDTSVSHIDVPVYGVPRSASYPYYISIDGQKKITGSFKVENYMQAITRTITWQADGTEIPKPTIGTAAVENGPAVTTVTHTTVKEEEPLFDYSEFEPEDYMISQGKEQYDLGENIAGWFTNEGTFSVWGYGDMYPNASIDSSVRSLIRRVIFYDKDPEENLCINNIANSLFSGSKNLEVVYMPEHLTAIGDSAFKNCENLKYFRYGGLDDTSTTLVLPSLLTYIGAEAFRGCKSAAFGDLIFPQSVQTIGKYAFLQCENITSMKIPGDSQPTIGYGAFGGCTKMKKAELCDGIAKLDEWIFNDCISLQELTLPYCGMSIDDTSHRFWHYLGIGTDHRTDVYKIYEGHSNAETPIAYAPLSLKTITITGGTQIPQAFFMQMEHLETVVLPDGITSIGKYAFTDCKELDDVQIPETVNEIGEKAFINCLTAFDKLILPENIRLIGDYAFQNCETITSVMVPGKSRPTIGDGAFKNCVKMEKTVLCDGVASIGKSIFNNCYSLQNLSLPYCGKSADDTSGRFYQYFGEGTDFRDKMYQIRFEDSVTSATVYYVPNVLTTIVVTGGKEVPSYFFKAMEKLESITLSGQTELVNDYAFNGCTSLKEAYLIGEDSDWDNVEIQNTNDSNKPLVDLVRQRKEGRPLMILADPQDQTVEDGKTALFYVYAAGKYELDYHWMYSWDNGENWMAVDSDGTNKLAVEASPEKDGYLYRCVITDGGHTERMTSGSAKLTVTEKQQTTETPQTSQDPKNRPGYKPGDANGDNSIDVSDAVLVARFAVGDVTATIKDIGVINGDVNGDGNTDIQDVTIILMFIAKRIMAFPIEET